MNNLRLKIKKLKRIGILIEKYVVRKVPYFWTSFDYILVQIVSVQYGIMDTASVSENPPMKQLLQILDCLLP